MDRAELKRIARRVMSVVSRRFVSPIIKPAFEAMLDANATNIPRMSRLRALEATADFINTHMREVQSFPDTFTLLDHVLPLVKPGPGLVCEFGVFKGRSINFIASRLKQTVYGFDSFEGLPEDWMDGLPRGAFKVDALPSVAANVTLVKGWFDQTLAPFLEKHPGDALFLHIDSDLYSSAKTIFDTFAPRIKEGTVIAFDERVLQLSGMATRRSEGLRGERRQVRLGVQAPGYTARPEQVALQITGVKR